jgi:hypothetical protein
VRPLAAGEVQVEDEVADEDEEPRIVELPSPLDVGDQALSSDSEQPDTDFGFDLRPEVDLDDSNYKNGGALKPKYIDLQHLEIRQFESMDSEILELKKFVPDASFFESLEELGKDLEDSIDDEMNQTELSASVTALVVTTGIMSWVLRAGSLLGGFLSVIPMWRQFDPLPILVEDEEKQNVTADDKEETESDDAVETLFDQKVK